MKERDGRKRGAVTGCEEGSAERSEVGRGRILRKREREGGDTYSFDYFTNWPFYKPSRIPSMNDILQHHQIQIEPPKERQFKPVCNVTTPNFIDS